MDTQKKYLTTLTFLLMLTNVALIALNEMRLDVYISLYTVCYFASTALFQPRKRTHDFIGLFLFLVFCGIVLMKIIEIIS